MSHFSSICLIGPFFVNLQTVIIIRPNDSIINCMVRSILPRAGLVQVFLLQAFSLFGPADGLPVHCF